MEHHCCDGTCGTSHVSHVASFCMKASEDPLWAVYRQAEGLHGAFLSSAKHRWGISRQRLRLVVLLVLPAKHQSRSVVLTAQVGEGRSVLGGNHRLPGTSNHLQSGETAAEGDKGKDYAFTSETPLQPQILADSLPRMRDSGSFIILLVSIHCKIHVVFFIPNVGVISSLKVIGTLSTSENTIRSQSFN